MYKKFGRFTTPVRNLYLAGYCSIRPVGLVFSALSGKLVSDGMYRGWSGLESRHRSKAVTDIDPLV